MLSFAVTVEKQTKIIEIADEFTKTELCDAIIKRFECGSDVTVKDLKYFDKDFNVFIDVDESTMSKLSDLTRLECTIQSTEVRAVFSSVVPTTANATNSPDDIDYSQAEPESEELEYDKNHNNCNALSIIRRRFGLSIIVANVTNKPIMVKVNQNRIELKGVSFGVEGGANITGFGEAKGEFKAALENILLKEGFCKIGPISRLEFRVSKLRKKIFISLYDESVDKLICDNYSPPKGNFVYTTTSGLQPSKRGKPFEPDISPCQAALIAKTDPKLARKMEHECAVDPTTGDPICWPTSLRKNSRNNS